MAVEDLVLEVGVEELPASFVKPALEFLRLEASVRFRRSGISPESIEVLGTPRRLILICYGVPDVQSGREEIIVGPSCKVAFDSNGNPTRALEGFARSKGIGVEDVVIIDNPAGRKGRYVAFVKKVKGIPARDILPSLLKSLVVDIPFKKKVVWGRGISFARPIKWVMCIFGGKVLDFEIAGIKSSSRSKGHKFMSPDWFEVKTPSQFISELEDRYVIASIEKRESIILDGIKHLSKSVGGSVVVDRDLLDEVVNLVEYPVPLMGTFDKAFLRLPKEVLIVVMKDHQRFFPVVGVNGGLVNRFIAISNIKTDDDSVIVRGYEKVLKARFDDALFFYKEDLSRKLCERINDLKSVVFYEGLGTLYDKVFRLRRLCRFVSDVLWGDREIADLSERAAYISKSDLVTEMVKEFPELQGTMGRYYAIEDGEDERVGVALEEQYLPRYFGDRVATTEVGIALSISDKIDNLVGFFGIGVRPSGSEDPFALRRSAFGVVHTLLHNKLNVGIRSIINMAFKLYSITLADDTCSCVEDYIKGRLRYLLVQDGFDTDVVDAVSGVTDDLFDIRERVRALQDLKREEDFSDLVVTFKRLMNIIPSGFTPVDFTPVGDYEKRLFDRSREISRSIKTFVDRGDYRRAFTEVKLLKPYVDEFFDNVLVMDKNETNRLRRLSLLKAVSDELLRLADFSKIKLS